MAQNEADQRLLVDKWNMLCEMEIVGEKGVFIFGQLGSLTYNELYTTLKVTVWIYQQYNKSTIYFA